MSGARLKIFKNRLVKCKVGRFEIFLNYGHSLPRIMEKHPEYAMNFLRLAEKMFEKYPQLKAIDVGANVGDTLALLKTAGVGETACIEGDGAYFEILKRNAVQFSKVSIFQEFLSDRLEEKLSHFSGQAISLHVVFEENGTHKIFRTGLSCHVPGHTVAAHEEGRNPGTSIRAAFAELERQLEKQKTIVRGERLRRRLVRHRQLMGGEKGGEDVT